MPPKLRFHQFCKRYGLVVAHFAEALGLTRAGLMYHTRLPLEDIPKDVADALSQELRLIGGECLRYADTLEKLCKRDDPKDT